MMIRKAGAADVGAAVALIEERRRRYEAYQPRFWKKAENSAALSGAWFAHLFADEKVVALVAEDDGRVVGFLIATNFPAPPVYDPGGPNALIDDFAVEAGRWATVGAELLTHARAELRARGFTQIVVVGARQDEEKTAFLETAELSLASTWWTGGI